MAEARPSTPPPARQLESAIQSRSPLTPEQVKKIEINRLKAKALREQREASAKATNPPSLSRNNSNIAAGQKRPFSATTTSNVPRSSRDARNNNPSSTTDPSSSSSKPPTFRPLDDIQAARNFKNYVEYDFSKMTDTKGGFMTAEDDPHNKALHKRDKDLEDKPAHMTLKEWERLQLLRKLREQKTGPFEPSLSAFEAPAKERVCRECGSMEIDFRWLEQLKCAVCNNCKEEHPDKYSLLTKTEAKEDYLLTDPELKDEELLPHIERPNPHKATWNNMMLYLRYQVEEYAFSEKKWGSGEKLDEEFERREGEKRRRKEGKFRAGLIELKKKTRVEAWRRARDREKGGAGGGGFGDEVGRGGKHEHVWGRAVEGSDGVPMKTCTECGMEVEELEF